MATDWRQVTADEMLNSMSSPGNPDTARYGRILQYRTNEVLQKLFEGMASTTAAISNTGTLFDKGTNQLGSVLQKQTAELIMRYDTISRGQWIQQWVLAGLTLVIAVATALYTWTTWESVKAMREANDIQRQLVLREKSKSENPARFLECGTTTSGQKPATSANKTAN